MNKIIFIDADSAKRSIMNGLRTIKEMNETAARKELAQAANAKTIKKTWKTIWMSAVGFVAAFIIVALTFIITLS